MLDEDCIGAFFVLFERAGAVECLPHHALRIGRPGLVADGVAAAGIALDKAQIASAGRALRRLQPTFPSGESLPPCTRSFADVLEGLGS